MAKTLADWLAHDKFTLALSSSFFGFYAHAGVVTALTEAGLRPARITGSSAGAIVGGALASGMPLPDLKKMLLSVRRTDFWDPAPGLGLLRGRKFRRLLEKHLAPSFDHAKIPFAAAALDVFTFRTRFLRDGSMATAVAASCAVPFLFQPVRIGRRLFLDGGVFHKSGVEHGEPSQRVFCVFLENAGLTGAYERRTSLREITPNHRWLRLRGLPQLHPHALEKGADAFAEAYARTRTALNAPAPRPFVEG